VKLFGLEIRRVPLPAVPPPAEPPPPPTRYLGEVVKVDLAPGDVCVLMSRVTLAREDRQMIGDLWRATVGDDVTLIVLDDGAKLGVLSPPKAVAVHERLSDEAVLDKALTP
jgi:hypothetical protein